jgi:hypothetical protein
MELLRVVTSSAARGRGEIIADWYFHKVIGDLKHHGQLGFGPS